MAASPEPELDLIAVGRTRTMSRSRAGGRWPGWRAKVTL